MKVENAMIKKTLLMPTKEGIGFILKLQGENWESDYSGIVQTVNGINAVIVALGADSWEQLTGHPVRINRDGSQIVNIGNFITNKWLTSNQNNIKKEPANTDGSDDAK